MLPLSPDFLERACCYMTGWKRIGGESRGEGAFEHAAIQKPPSSGLAATFSPEREKGKKCRLDILVRLR